MLSVLIKDATVYDGGGHAPFQADIAIEGERIREVVSHESHPEGLKAEAQTVIDAAGRIVTPGFVDPHAHSEFNVLVEPNAESKLRQGVTTEITGNCGMGAFPLRGVALKEAQEQYRKLGIEVDWASAPEYFERLERAKPAINQATYVPHGNVRASVMSYEDRPPTADEMQAMQREIESAIEAGALGFSTGLLYPPGMFADTAEIVELQSTATRLGGIYTSHVRGEGDRLLNAAQEFLTVVEQTGCQGQYSHLKASGVRNWGKVARIIEQIEETNANGGLIRFDKYPYIASGTDLSSLLPRWVLNGGRDAAAERLTDPPQRARILRELREDFGEYTPWDSILIVQAGIPTLAFCEGKTIHEIGRMVGRTEEEVFVDLLVKSRLHTTICNFTMSQEDTDMAILHPLGMVCSDSEIRTTTGPLSEGSPHPRAFGSFGKFFREYVKQRKLLKLEEAVAKVTSLPCETFGFAKRGRILPGYFADLLVIDWNGFRDRADFTDPCHYCEGVESVIVNGTLTLHHGNYTGQRAGRLLHKV